MRTNRKNRHTVVLRHGQRRAVSVRTIATAPVEWVCTDFVGVKDVQRVFCFKFSYVPWRLERFLQARIGWRGRISRVDTLVDIDKAWSLPKNSILHFTPLCGVFGGNRVWFDSSSQTPSIGSPNLAYSTSLDRQLAKPKCAHKRICWIFHHFSSFFSLLRYRSSFQVADGFQRCYWNVANRFSNQIISDNAVILVDFISLVGKGLTKKPFCFFGISSNKIWLSNSETSSDGPSKHNR